MRVIFSFFLALIYCAIPHKSECTLIGNPSNPSLQTKGVFLTPSSWASIRVSYFGDYVYNQEFQDTFPIDGCTQSASQLKIWTQAGMGTFNIKNRIDLYGIVGGMRLQIDEEAITKQQFTWGVGGKVIFFHEGRFRAGCDIKYLQSNQVPSFFQCDHLAYNVASNFHFSYSELQTALGLAYRTKYFSPYANASYLIAKAEPSPPMVSVRLPMMDEEVDVMAKSITASNRFGLALGATIIDKKKATLAIEWRSINQNSIDVTGELRF
jgi:hypothetical protein